MPELRDLGFSATAEQVYLHLLSVRSAEIGHLAAELDADEPADVDAAIAELEQNGLVERIGDRVSACPPRVPLEQRASRLIQDAATIREYADLLAMRWNGEHSDDSSVQVLTRQEDTDDAVYRLHSSATERVRALCVGPQRSVSSLSIQPGSLDALRRGVSYQVVYGTEILQHPVALEFVRTSMEAGEQGRVTPSLPFNLVIGEEYALLMYTGPEPTRLHQLQVDHRSALYDALVALFEHYWQLAAPLSAAVEPEQDLAAPMQAAEDLLRLLMAGLTDEAIARELKVSERTVARRISALHQQLGARSRFQLGVQAVRRGWL